jgi:hypothetical protein
MTTRRFVLEPAAEIAADLRHPLAGCTLAALLENLSAPHPHIAVVGVPGSGAPEVAVAVADALLARLVHAPVPLPAGRKRPAATDGLAETRWRNLLAAWAQPLEPEAWLDDPHGTVSDFWIGAIGLAAEEDLDAAAHDRLRQQCDQAAARTVAPQVAIVLSASAEAIEERIAFRGRQAQPSTNVFADLTPAAAAVCDSPADTVGGLLRLQRRLIERLTCPAQRPAGAPKAVVLIEADDLARAAADATAAVEAMV